MSSPPKSHSVDHDGNAMISYPVDVSRDDALNSSGIAIVQTVEREKLPNAEAPVKKMILFPPNWINWKTRASLKLWEAVSLSKNIEPRKLLIIEHKHTKIYLSYFQRLQVAQSWLVSKIPILDHPDNGERTQDKIVRLEDFVRCACEMASNWEMPPQLIAIGKELGKPVVSRPNIEPLPEKQESESIAKRNQKLQETANKIAQELKKTMKTRVTRRKVVEALHKQDEWNLMTKENIERNIRVQWK